MSKQRVIRGVESRSLTFVLPMPMVNWVKQESEKTYESMTAIVKRLILAAMQKE